MFNSKKNSPAGNFVINVPIEEANTAATLIQTHVRIYLARIRLEELKTGNEYEPHLATENKSTYHSRAVSPSSPSSMVSRTFSSLSKRAGQTNAEPDGGVSNANSTKSSAAGAISGKVPKQPYSLPINNINTSTATHVTHSAKHSTKSTMSSLNAMRSPRGVLGDIASRIMGGSQPPPPTDLLIYPFVAFVIKSRLMSNQKKLFLNICHSPLVSKLMTTPV